MPEQAWVLLSNNKKYPYTIVYSARAKYIRLKLSCVGELTLVIPKGISQDRGIEFIQSKTCWIEKKLAKILIQPDELPKILDLKLLSEKWKIVYLEKEIQHPALRKVAKNTLEISISMGAETNQELVKKLINKWCRYKAKPVFDEMLWDIAQQYGFQYGNLIVRSQKTRWGSCSQDRNISLNSKLLFFKEKIVRHVMIHELCHTIEMNHSKRFWALVKNCDPDYLENKEQLRQLGRGILL